MATIDHRFKKAFFGNKYFKEDMLKAIEELIKLEGYYEDELTQIRLDFKEAKDKETKAYLAGLKLANETHMEEISYIIELMRGKKHDTEDK